MSDIFRTTMIPAAGIRARRNGATRLTLTAPPAGVTAGDILNDLRQAGVASDALSGGSYSHCLRCCLSWSTT